MPYKIEMRDGKHCVMKEDGKTIACHDDEQGAKDQMAALYANENKKSLERYTQEAVAYTPVSSTAGQMCANCRWFIGTNDGGPMCHVMENEPLDVEATGWCQEHASIETAMLENEMPMMAQMSAGGELTIKTLPMVSDMNGISEIITPHADPNHLSHVEMDSIYIASQEPGVLKNALDKITRKGGLKPGTSILKANGTRYMMVVTSNSYQDREAETITTQALKEYVDKSWIAEDLFHTNNPLLFWHDDRLEIGQIVWADMHGPFLVELAQEGTSPVSKALFDYRETHPEEKWGASHRFAYFRKDRSDDGTYRRIYKQETSMLPREAAANLLTFSGVIPMTDKRGETLNKMLGIENAAELLDKGIEAVVAEMERRGVAHKSAEKPESIDANTEKTLSKFVMALMDSQADLIERQDTLESGVGTSSKSLTDETSTLKEQVKALTSKLEALQVQLDQRPRSASRASETELQDGEKLAAELKKQLTKRDPFFGVEVKE